jgi:flagellar basal-body rod protein FlgG
MIRALYTAASGMTAQQANIDNVAHNLANANTAGFKKAHVEFADLVYDQSRVPGSPTSTTAEAPIGIETGLGVRVVATARDFGRGNLRSTNAPLDIAIEGDGFFQVQLPSGEIGYTRTGSFHLNADGALVTSEGYQVEPQITIPANATSVSISRQGVISVSIPGQAGGQQVGTLELASFQNPAGLRAMGGNMFQASTASGEPQVGAAGDDSRGTVAQGFVEDSNVSVVEEMVNMILGQRAYEANSKVIKAADEMLQQVNTLAR